MTRYRFPIAVVRRRWCWWAWFHLGVRVELGPRVVAAPAMLGAGARDQHLPLINGNT